MLSTSLLKSVIKTSAFARNKDVERWYGIVSYEANMAHAGIGRFTKYDYEYFLTYFNLADWESPTFCLMWNEKSQLESFRAAQRRAYQDKYALSLIGAIDNNKLTDLTHIGVVADTLVSHGLKDTEDPRYLGSGSYLVRYAEAQVKFTYKPSQRNPARFVEALLNARTTYPDVWYDNTLVESLRVCTSHPG